MVSWYLGILKDSIIDQDKVGDREGTGWREEESNLDT